MNATHTRGTGYNVLALIKGDERYVWLYTDSHRPEVLRRIGRMAANPELSLTWKDAAVLSGKVAGQKQDPLGTTPGGMEGE